MLSSTTYLVFKFRENLCLDDSRTSDAEKAGPSGLTELETFGMI